MPDARGARGVRFRAAACPSARDNSATPMPPGRSRIGVSPAKATIVDSIPTAQAPPSRIDATDIAEIVGDVRAPSSARCGRTGWPTGAAMPPPNAASSARATGCDGTRSPTLSWPPVTMSETCEARGRISVSGPGQNVAASFLAASGTERAQCAISAGVHGGGRSPDGRRAGPSRRRSCARRRDCRRRRRVRRRFRSETRRARRRAAGRPPPRWRPASASRWGAHRGRRRSFALMACRLHRARLTASRVGMHIASARIQAFARRAMRCASAAQRAKTVARSGNE